MCFKFVWNRKQDRINRKTVIKSIKKGGMSTWSMPLFGQKGFVICPLLRMMAKFDYMTISTFSHHVYIVMDASEHVYIVMDANEHVML